MNNATIEERLTQLENYIGDMKQLKFYANSLQETLDRYVSPLYIEKTDNEGNCLFIDSYLGRPNEIPPYSLIKVRASHTLAVPENNPGTKIIFKRGEETVEYPLMKMAADDNLFDELESGDFVNGNVYEIYFNAQNIAIISSSNSGVTALNLVQSLTKTVEDLQKNLESLGFSNNDLTLKGKLIANDIEVVNAKVATSLDISTVTELTLPQGTEISDPTNNTDVANKQYVDKTVSDKLTTFFDAKHIFGTADGDVILQGKDNNTIYFKLEG